MAIQSLVFSTAHKGRAWAGDARGILWRSTDAGLTWEPAGKLKSGIRGILPDPRQPDAVLVASDGGIFPMTVGGRPASALLASAKPGATALTRHPRFASLMLAALDGAIQRNDDGRRWRRTGAFLDRAESFAYHRKGGTVYLCASNELWRSLDDGNTWVKQDKTAYGVFQDPLRDSRWYGLQSSRPTLDDGAGFMKFDRSLPTGKAGDAAVMVGGSDFVALVGKSGIFYRTFCGVDDWSPIERYSTDGPDGTASALAVDPNAWKAWLASDDRGIWRTEDVAKTWKLVAEIR